MSMAVTIMYHHLLESGMRHSQSLATGTASMVGDPGGGIGGVGGGPGGGVRGVERGSGGGISVGEAGFGIAVSTLGVGADTGSASGGGGLLPVGGASASASASGAHSDLEELYAQLQEFVNHGMGSRLVNYTAAAGGNMTGMSGGLPGGVPGVGGWDLGDYLTGTRPLSAKATVAILLGALGLLANFSSLVAISRIRSSLTANLRLIVSLCASDMLVSGSLLLRIAHEAQPISSTGGRHQLSAEEDTCVENVLKALRVTSHIVSLLNLVGLAFDHYCAILKPLNYPTLMCRKRANIMIVCFWLLAVLFGFSDFVMPSAYFSYCKGANGSGAAMTLHYCTAVWCSVYMEEYVMFAVAILSAVLIASLYAMIFVQIRRYQNFQQQYRPNMKRNRRGLVTTLVIVFTFMVTWLPYCLFDVVVIIVTHTSPAESLHYVWLASQCEFYFYTLLLLNSFLDPLIYAIRMREVQNGYRNMFFPCVQKRKRSLSRALSQSTDRSRFTTNHNSQYSKTNQHESYL